LAIAVGFTEPQTASACSRRQWPSSSSISRSSAGLSGGTGGAA